MPIETVLERRAVTWRVAGLVGLVLVVALLPGCGAGTAAIVAGSGDSGGGGTTPALDLFALENPKVSPGLLRIDASQPVRVALFYDVGGGETALSKLEGIVGNEVDVPVGEVMLEWDFADEPGIGTSEYRPGARLMAKLGGSVIGGGDLTLGLGNDPPVVTSITPLTTAGQPFLQPGDEAAGNVEVVLGLSDSSSDVVTVLVDWRRTSDAPEDWQPATVGGLPTGVGTSPSEQTFSFFWRTTADGLDTAVDEFLLRVTADDGTLDQGLPVGVGVGLSPAFHVDNNAAPIVQLFNDAVISNPDERRGIPVPFRVFDEESDRVEVIFQWRREGEEFPELLESEIDAVLADPVLRRERHICTEYPRFAQGLVVPIDATTVRLPELARESWILASGLVGRTLELLRPASTLEPITPTWALSPLVVPVAALPAGDGLTALVLDAPGNGRLREIELATGAIVREIAALGPGAPSAMALERGEQAVLVATDLSGAWRIERVELASGAITELIVSDGSQPGPVRGIASLGTSAAVFTAGSVLFSLDYRDPLAPQLGTLLSGLATPWGVVVDPLPPNRLYLAERDAVTANGTGRVLAVELDSHEELPVVVRTEDLQPAHLERPSALALERHGARILVVTNEPGGTSQLVGLDLGAQGRNVSFPIGPPRASEIASIATGPKELRSATFPGEHELLIGGGLEQRRAVVAYESAGQEATLDAALQPEVRPGRIWRIPAVRGLFASPAGLEAAFVWSSSSDVPGGGPAFLRAIARDDELGLATEGRAPKHVRAALDVAPRVLGGLGILTTPDSVAAADLDGDGDQDLVSANQDGNNLTVFFQVLPGSFAAAPLVLGGPGITNSPSSVAAADLDGDGDQDLVSANRVGNNLTVFFQVSPGSFAAAPLVLGGPATTNSPSSVAAADLDGDGDQDLVSAVPFQNQFRNELVVFFQVSPGSFAASPARLGFNSVFPLCVAAADLDGDGDQDLVSGNDRLANSDLTVFFQDSPGSFAATPLVLGGFFITNHAVSVAAADLDGDGDQDLVSANQFGNNLTVFFQESSGSFAAAPLVLGGLGLTDGPSSVTTADLDGDGDQDLVSANSGEPFGLGGNTMTVFFQVSPGSFAPAPLVLGGPAITSQPVSVAAADLDGDGDQDLVSANFTGNDLTVSFQGSPGSFAAAPLVLGGSAIANFSSSVAAADLDGDGDQDLVSANRLLFNSLTVFFQVSPGSFASAPLVLGGPGITPELFSVAAADLDGDGDQDLVSANVGGDTLTISFQESPGSFAAATLLLGGPALTEDPLSVAAADLDGDGDQDLVSANSGSSNLTVFFQESSGSFAAPPLVLGGPAITSFPVSVAAADLDGDGDQDLVSANSGSSNLTVFFQESSGSFAAAPLVLGGPAITSFPVSVAAADFDGDGDQDLVSANGNNLTVFIQVSPGSFATAPLVLGGPGITNSPRSVAAADFDGDGDQDLVSANFGAPFGVDGDSITVFIQVSPGSFASAPLVLLGPAIGRRPVSVAAADLDGDGEQDLVSAFGANLTVFWGGR